MKNTVEQFLGLWVDSNRNVLFIKSPEANTVKVSFASGKIMSPIKRCSMHQQLTIDVDGEYGKEPDLNRLRLRITSNLLS